MAKKKNQFNDEIDISEIIIFLWKNKMRVFFITLITVIISIYSFQNKPNSTETVFLAKTKIVPISIFNENDYAAYNAYLTSVEKKSIGIYNIDLDKGELEKSLVITKDFNEYNLFANSSFKNIDRLYLYDLFIEKLNHNDFFIKAIKKFNLLIKSEDYQNNLEYEKAVIKLATAIKKPNIESDDIDKPRKTFSYIEFETNNKNKIVWEKFLVFLENYANNEIQIYLKKNFELLISNENRLKQYKIEDIEFETANNLEKDQIVSDLSKLKDRIVQNKDIERLKNVFMNTPIVLGDFFAAKMKIRSNKYIVLKKAKKNSTIKIIFLSTFLGLLLSVIYIFCTNIIINRK
jgi:hypothetical protein